MRNPARLAGLSLLALMTGTTLSLAQATPGAKACAALATLALPGYDLQIRSARHVAHDGVPHCLVKGSFEHRVGVNSKEYALGFALALPDEWNGRFLYEGGGGLNGTVKPPLGALATRGVSARDRGFAVITTDSGHAGRVWDASFDADQIASLNFAGWSIEKVAGLGKQLVATYYGKPADYSYFAGCSTGGREGMSATERYPLLFDGVIAGAPAMQTNRSGLFMAAKAVVMNKISPLIDGKPDRSRAFSDTDRQLILNAMRKSCDGLDGLEDGMIFNTDACRFDPATLVCNGEKTDSCLTAAQADAVRQIFAPLVDADGQTLYPSFPYDTGIMTETDRIPGIMRFDDKRNLQYANTAPSFDLGAQQTEADAQMPLVQTDMGTNLSSFALAGHKVLYFHGVSDPWFSANKTRDYYEQMLARTAPLVPGIDWSELYLVPGMSHCSGGPASLDRFDLLTPLIDWVENGTTPANVVATGEDFPGRSRPLCPYPSYASYAGKGDPEDAASFTCRQPDGN